MPTFKLDTEAVTSVASSISSLASEFDNLASTFDGFDTDCGEDSFDFAGAKAVIVGNLKACSSKVKNTAKLMEKVVSAHSTLQGSMKFETSAEKAANAGKTSTGTGGSSGYTSSGSSSYSSGGSSYSSSGGSNYSSTASYTTTSVPDSGSSVGVPTTIYSSSNSDLYGSISNEYLTDSESMAIASAYGLSALPTGSYETESGLVVPGYEYKLPKEDFNPYSVVGLPSLGILAVDSLGGNLVNEWYYGHNVDDWHFFSGVQDIECKTVANSNISAEIKNKITYNNEGYAMSEDRYVISCDKYFGDVGDKVQVITEDKVLECIIGSTSKELDNSLTFYTNESCNGNYIKENVSTLSLKSINNLEYVQGGSKYGTDNYPDEYTVVRYDSRSTMTVLDENGGISYGILESDRNNINIIVGDDMVSDINNRYKNSLNTIV